MCEVCRRPKQNGGRRLFQLFDRGGHFLRSVRKNILQTNSPQHSSLSTPWLRWFTLLTLALPLAGCGTVVAIADGIGTAAVYSVKTVVNTLDAITPDIVNGDDDDDD